MTKHKTTTETEIANSLAEECQSLFVEHSGSPTINYDMMLGLLNTAEGFSMNCDDYFYDDWDKHFDVIRKGLQKRRQAWANLCGAKLKYV
jgi:hypothetical protein